MLKLGEMSLQVLNTILLSSVNGGQRKAIPYLGKGLPVSTFHTIREGIRARQLCFATQQAMTLYLN